MEKFDCGCSITFGTQGEVRAVNVCDTHDQAVFSEHKSLRQLANDIHHQQSKEKHTPKPPPPPKEEEPKTEEAKA